jgi:hypothetical protein
VDSPERSQHSHDSLCHDPDSVVPCCSMGSGSHSSSAASAAQGCPEGVESAALGAGTAERSAETAGTAVAGTDTATASHNLLSGLLDGTGLPAVR